MTRDYREAPRPNHNNAKTTSELKKEEFSGTRLNLLAEQLEFWVFGEIRFTLSKHEHEVNPGKWEALCNEFLNNGKIRS